MNQIKTERLTIRPFKHQDVEAAFGYFKDPEVMRFISGGPDSSLEVTRKRLEKYAVHQNKHGFI